MKIPKALFVTARAYRHSMRAPDWKLPNKQSPYRHGDAQGGVPGPGVRRSPSSFRFATQTFEALRPLCVLADHPFLFAPQCLGVGHVLLLTHVMGCAVTGFLTGVWPPF
jgi:hypothetical protein